MKMKKIRFLLFIAVMVSAVFGLTAFAAEQPQNTAQPSAPKVTYQAHVQNIGDQKAVADGAVAGTSGQSKRIEALKIWVTNAKNSGITYRAHVQKIGWQGWQKNGGAAGTKHKSLRIEALQIKLTGDIAKNYDVYYCTHVQNYGWLAWAKNGETAGTEGLSFRVEAVRIVLVKKGAAAPDPSGHDSRAALSKALFKQRVGVRYQAHVQKIGWQHFVNAGQTAGTTGKRLRVEAYRVALDDKLSDSTYMTYHAHIQNIGDKQGWVNSKNANAFSGTTGQGKRVEAIQMKLGGYAAGAMDVYYRVHAQNIGWTGWAKNGEWAGTSGGGLRVEAIQIVLRTKNEAAPGSRKNHYTKMTGRSALAVRAGKVPGTTRQSNQKVVYLTFDDGPSSVTQQVLNVLDRYHVKATFFVTNQQPKYAYMIKRAYSKGHTIGLHSYSHQYSIYRSEATYFNDLNQIGQVVKRQIGYVPAYVRFPGGSSNTVSRKYSRGIMLRLASAVHQRGYQYYDWNASSGDGNRRNLPVNKLVSNSLACHDKNIVLLCHDTESRRTTVSALPRIIEGFKKRGYVFRPITADSYAPHHPINN